MARLFAIFALLITNPVSGTTMEHNLAIPWGDRCSPPQNPLLSFHSRQADDLLFASGARIELVCQAGLRSVGLRWTLHRNMFDTPFRSGVAEALPANRFAITIDTVGLHPGFYDLRVELDSGLAKDDKDVLLRRPVRGVCTFGWKTGELAISDTRPADFEAFWTTARARIDAVPLCPIEESLQSFGPEEINAYNVASACLPPDFDPAGHRCERVESGKVSFAGPDGGRVHGWLAKPEGAGPFPAMLVLPGGGFAARPRPLEHARHGYLSLDIQVHGQEVDLPSYPRLPHHFEDLIYAPTEAYYYYYVHQRCLQALNYLCTRPDVDRSRIVVVGGSQGGRLSVVVAGLDRRIRAAVPAIAHFANQPYLRWAARCNGLTDLGGVREPARMPQNGMDVAAGPPLAGDAIERCLAYYDPMNFAPGIICPVLFNVGMVDTVSPPISVFAVYNRIPGNAKAMIALDGLGHDWCAEFDRRAFRWLDSVLAAKP